VQSRALRDDGALDYVDEIARDKRGGFERDARKVDFRVESQAAVIDDAAEDAFTFSFIGGGHLQLVGEQGTNAIGDFLDLGSRGDQHASVGQDLTK
jgi:hypothetical protein